MKQTDLHTRLLFLSISLTWLAAPLTSLAQKTTGPQSHFNYEQAWDIVDSLSLNGLARQASRSEEHTSELQSLMRISYAVFCLKKKNEHRHKNQISTEKYT